MTETEIGIMIRQCLDRHLDDPAVVRNEVSAWETERTETKAAINWRFTVADARVKLQNIYPSIKT